MDLGAIGRQYYKVDLYLARFGRIEEIRRWIGSSRVVAYTERTLASGDLEFDLEVEDFDAFIAFMDELRSRFPEEIRDYEYYSLVRSHKTSYVPGPGPASAIKNEPGKSRP